MNKHLHRIVFNAARGQRMAVAETAASHSRPASGQTTGASAPASPSGQASAGPTGLAASPLACATLAVLALLAGQPLAFGQIIADPNAPGNQRPTVLGTANGLPQVNIQTPSAAGVSRNTYRQFDVQPQGAILNNSRTSVQTQQGGWVQGNPWLAGGSARVIVNEVNSTNPSLLRGYTEVAGPRAEVIIANPAGISVNGGGFLNASRVTLTTGTPVFSGGNLDAYRVQGGTVNVGGAGLDTSGADYTAILARAVQVNAGIWANRLHVVTGTNQFDAAQPATSATPLAGSGPAPAFALDVAQLGGMYAGQITLVGTEAGVGVRNAGIIGATAGDLVLQANGWLTNSGTLQGQGNTSVSASAVTNTGRVLAGQTLALATAGVLDNTSGTLSAQRLDVSADSLLNQRGVIEQTGPQGLALQSQRLSNAAGGDIGLLPQASPPTGGTGTDTAGNTGTTGVSPGSGSGSGTAPAGTTAASTSAPVPLADGRLTIAGTLNNDAGRISAAGGTDLSSDTGLNNDGGSLRLRQLNVTGGDVSNRSGLITAEATRLSAQALDNTSGRIISVGSALLSAQTLNNTTGQLTAGGTLSVTTSQALVNRSGLIAANGAVNLSTGSLDNTGGEITQAGNADTLITSAGELNNTGGRMANRRCVYMAALSSDEFRSWGERRSAELAPQPLSLNRPKLPSVGKFIRDTGRKKVPEKKLYPTKKTWKP